MLPTVLEIAAMPLDDLLPLLGHLTTLVAAIQARLCAVPVPSPEHDVLLTIEQAAARLAVPPQWLRRRPSLPFIVRLSPGVVRYSRQGLDAYLAAHRVG